MKDKKHILFISLICLISFGIISLTILNTVYYLEKYDYNQSIIIDNIIFELKKQYPDFDEEEIIKILNSEELTNKKTLSSYGININNESISLANKKIIKNLVINNVIIVLGNCLFILLLIYLNRRRKEKNIEEIVYYLKEINRKNYKLDISDNKENELSVLKNEIYKTAIYLNEQANNSYKDKIALKDYLSDISHQIKTPLTSINLMIDNLIENKSLNEEKKNGLIISIRHKISSINFLIQSLLILSKIDANTIEFNNENVFIKEIIDEVIDNTSAICDLKNIKINVKGNKKDKLYCDFKWQVEALTNIVKNCAEASYENSVIDISYVTNDLFTKIIITDYGKGMDEKDRKNIFKRFYKGKNQTKDSVGIGLSLAKSIIEKNNGYIVVESKLNKGTTFIIKFMK